MTVEFDILRGVDLFAGLDDPALAHLLEATEAHFFVPGQAIVRIGETEDVGMWILVEGRAEVRLGDQSVAEFSAGDYFGEMSLFAPEPAPRSADVVAVSLVTALRLTREAARESMEQSPAMALAMLNELADRLRRTNEQLAGIADRAERRGTEIGAGRALRAPRSDLGFLGGSLGGIGKRRRFRLAGITFIGKRRRPSGERPPLPRQLRGGFLFWAVLAIVMTGVWMSILAIDGTADWWTDRDHSLLGWFVDIRTSTLDSLGRALHALGSEWFIRPLRWCTLLAIITFRRWRHLVTGLVAIALVEVVVTALTNEVGRARPLVEIIGSWTGYSHPSGPLASLAVTLGVAGQSLLPSGRWRRLWFAGTGTLAGLLAISRMYLGVDHPTDAVMATLFGFGVSVMLFRLIVPDAVFPVTYRSGKKAHLDVGGQRGEAIRQAVYDQVGIDITDLEPFALEGSGGSTPLRLSTTYEEAPVLFGKLYAGSHLASDRWYKIGRTILYGRLEDEVRFTSVRRLVEYEDYLLHLMRDAGLPSAAPYGFVEITPEREYLLLTEFLDGAVEMSEADVDEDIIDEALWTVRRMWDAGLAHRDVKPANVLVRDRHVVLIDVAFATVRPTPWRQAVDLANMMMILALRADPQHVYDRALRFFSPDDIAEAFAATRGITIPRELRSRINDHEAADGADVIARFRELAPAREPIVIQRWSLRRALLAAALLITAGALGVILNGNGAWTRIL